MGGEKKDIKYPSMALIQWALCSVVLERKAALPTSPSPNIFAEVALRWPRRSLYLSLFIACLSNIDRTHVMCAMQNPHSRDQNAPAFLNSSCITLYFFRVFACPVIHLMAAPRNLASGSASIFSYIDATTKNAMPKRTTKKL